MDKPMSDRHFKFMTFGYKFRDLFLPRRKILDEVGIKEGFQILDYGCGPGGYVAAFSKLVGKSGEVYALDIHPLAIQKVKDSVSKYNLLNVKTICSDCKTGLPDNSIDTVLLYDAFHELSHPNRVLKELYRVLKSKGILSFSDHHMKEDEIVSKLTDKDLFRLLSKGKRTYSFLKEE